MNLYPKNEADSWESGPWSVNIELAYLSGELIGRIMESQVGDGLVQNEDCVMLIQDTETLDTQFASDIAKTLKNLIEKATPIVNEFEDERTNEENS